MGELTPAQASTLSLLVKHKQSYGEVAARLGMNSLTVRVRAHEAAAILAGLGPVVAGDGLMIDQALGQLPIRDVGVLAAESGDRDANRQRERLAAALEAFLGTQVRAPDRRPAVLERAAPPLIESEDPVVVESDAPSLVESEDSVVVESDARSLVESEQPVVVESEQPVVVESEQPVVVESEQPVVVGFDAPPGLEPVAPAQLSVTTLGPAAATVDTGGPRRRRSRAGAARTRAILSLGLGSLAAGVVLLINGAH